MCLGSLEVPTSFDDVLGLPFPGLVSSLRLLECSTMALQANQGPPVARADRFALPVTFFELLTDRPLFLCELDLSLPKIDLGPFDVPLLAVVHR